MFTDLIRLFVVLCFRGASAKTLWMRLLWIRLQRSNSSELLPNLRLIYDFIFRYYSMFTRHIDPMLHYLILRHILFLSVVISVDTVMIVIESYSLSRFNLESSCLFLMYVCKK